MGEQKGEWPLHWESGNPKKLLALPQPLQVNLGESLPPVQ